MTQGKKQRRVVGAVLQVPLGDGSHVYAQTLAEADFAFFDHRSDRSVSVPEVVVMPVLFRVAVHKSAWVDGRWPRVGAADVRPDLTKPTARFIQDPLHPSRFQIYVAGEIREASKQECVGLERCAVWDPQHVEDRLRDHYAGRTCRWVESLRIR